MLHRLRVKIGTLRGSDCNASLTANWSRKNWLWPTRRTRWPQTVLLCKSGCSSMLTPGDKGQKCFCKASTPDATSTWKNCCQYQCPADEMCVVQFSSVAWLIGLLRVLGGGGGGDMRDDSAVCSVVCPKMILSLCEWVFTKGIGFSWYFSHHLAFFFLVSLKSQLNYNLFCWAKVLVSLWYSVNVCKG